MFLRTFRCRLVLSGGAQHGLHGHVRWRLGWTLAQEMIRRLPRQEKRAYQHRTLAAKKAAGVPEEFARVLQFSGA